MKKHHRLYSLFRHTENAKYTHCHCITIIVVVDHFYSAILCSLANSLHSCHTWSWMRDCSLFQHIEYPWNRIHTLHHCKCCISLSSRTILGSWADSRWMWLWMSDCSLLLFFEHPLNKMHTLHHLSLYITFTQDYSRLLNRLTVLMSHVILNEWA